MESVPHQHNPVRCFPAALRLLAEEYPQDALNAAVENNRAELQGKSDREAYALLSKVLAAARPPAPTPIAKLAQAHTQEAAAAVLADLNAKATPRPLPAREQADRECIPRKEPWDRPRRRNNPPEYRTPGSSGRRETPWDLFRMAGFSPSLLTAGERSIIRTVYWVHSLGKGWGRRDRTSANAPGIRLEPARLARYLGTTRRSTKRTIERLVAWELLRVVERVPGYPSLYCSNWWHGKDAEEANLAALRRSLALLTRRRPPRSGGCGKPRRKVASVPPSVPSPVPPSVPSSVPSPVPTPLGTDETGNPPEDKGLADPKCTIASGISESLNLRKKESQKRTPSAGVATPSQEQEPESDSPRGGQPKLTGKPKLIAGLPGPGDWEELRRIACDKLTHPSPVE